MFFLLVRLGIRIFFNNLSYAEDLSSNITLSALSFKFSRLSWILFPPWRHTSEHYERKATRKALLKFSSCIGEIFCIRFMTPSCLLTFLQILVICSLDSHWLSTSIPSKISFRSLGILSLLMEISSFGLFSAILALVTSVFLHLDGLSASLLFGNQLLNVFNSEFNTSLRSLNSSFAKLVVIRIIWRTASPEKREKIGDENIEEQRTKYWSL